MHLLFRYDRINLRHKQIIIPLQVCILPLVKMHTHFNVLVMVVKSLCRNNGVCVFRCGLRLALFYLVAMNQDKTVVFIGHSDCPLTAEQIIPYVEREILSGARFFINGGQGAFDRAAARAVLLLKQRYPEIRNILVIPYHNFKIFDETLFDEVISPNISYQSNLAYKSAIPKRNNWMVKNASVAICYISHISGGAYKTYQQAKKVKKKIVNICSFPKKYEY